jgi:hypothetical protein
MPNDTNQPIRQFVCKVREYTRDIIIADVIENIMKPNVETGLTN